jgi:antitoxin component YwqK of YwqJK toxin-antitoxin module
MLVFEGEYRDGKRHGKFNKYYDDGKPLLLQSFSDDALDGIKKSFDKEGHSVETKYVQGKKVS